MVKLSRRNFLTAFSSSLLGLGLSKKTKASLNETTFAQSQFATTRVQKYNSLGATGIKVSDVSFGAISLFEPNVLRYAYDLGVTYFDTAESYVNTKSESYIGQALKDIRDKITITTKHPYSPRQQIRREDVIRRVEASLKRMQTDYVDVAMIHNISDLALLKNEELRAAYAQLKKDGKIRFTGFSSHNPKLHLKQALENDFCQVALFIYNNTEGKEAEPVIEEARRKGIGTVAMKVFAGGMQGNLKSLINQELSYPQAAIRWVLSNPNIDCCIVTMSSYSHVEEYVAASGKPLNRESLQMIADYQCQTSSEYCRVSCERCLSSCPNKVAINEILRYGMYFENYRMEKEAMRYYAQLEESKKPLRCSGCSGYCDSVCPYGLRVRKKLMHAHEILSA
jgi:predicted aldo/keto reductase-like oxidoreductase